MRIWDLTRNKPLSEINLSKDRRNFTCAALSADGKIVALGQSSGEVTFWQAETGTLVRQFAKLPDAVTSLSFSPDGRMAGGRTGGRTGERP